MSDMPSGSDMPTSSPINPIPTPGPGAPPQPFGDLPAAPANPAGNLADFNPMGAAAIGGAPTSMMPPPPPPSLSGSDQATSGKVPKSTAALVLGIVGLVPIVVTAIFSLLALIFGLKGRSANKAAGGRLEGGGKATAGIVLGIVGLVLNAGVLAVAVNAALKEDSIDNIKVGRCYSVPADGAVVSSLKKQDCAKPHDAEAYFVFDLPDEPFPGQAEVSAAVEERCTVEFEKFVGVPLPASELDLFSISPSKDSWEQSRSGICLVLDTANPATGSLRNAKR
jgi:hypothetical protein